MFKMIFFVSLSLALFILSGCSNQPHKPAKIVTKAPAPVVAIRPATPQIRAYRAPEKAHYAEAKPNRSVALLMQRAQTEQHQGKLQAAGKTLQRAIRITPQNATLWHQLAEVRFAQGRYQQAGQLAAKSNTLAYHDRQLQAKNQRLIARTRQAAKLERLQSGI